MTKDEQIFRLKHMVRRLGALIPGLVPGEEDKMVRASGDAKCDVCKLALHNHPVCMDGILHVGCDGTLYKL